MVKSVEERAAEAKFTANDNKVFDFIMCKKRVACFLTTNEIAEYVGASPSSVVRISRKLGYENFSAFRRALQEDITGESAANRHLVPHEKIKHYQNLSDKDILSAYSSNILNNLLSDTDSENDKKIIAAAKMISEAKHVYIVGFRACAGFAASASVMLSCIRADVTFPCSGRPTIDSLIDMTPDDVMMAISFARYSTETSFAVQLARDAGCPVIAMTDSYAAPIAKDAAKVIISNSGSMGFFDSYIGFWANVEKIFILASKYCRSTNEARLEKMEKYLGATGRY